MAKLSKAVKEYIVKEQACFERPSEIRDRVKELYGVDLKLNHIVYYNAANRGDDLAPEWRELFWATRKKFIDDSASIAIGHRSVRLRTLDRLARKVEEALEGPLPKKNLMLLKELIGEVRALNEQAAKEVGDAFTNRRMLLSGDPEEELAKSLGVTKEQLREAMADAGVGGTAPSE